MPLSKKFETMLSCLNVHHTNNGPEVCNAMPTIQCLITVPNLMLNVALCSRCREKLDEIHRIYEVPTETRQEARSASG